MLVIPKPLPKNHSNESILLIFYYKNVTFDLILLKLKRRIFNYLNLIKFMKYNIDN